MSKSAEVVQFEGVGGVVRRPAVSGCYMIKKISLKAIRIDGRGFVNEMRYRATIDELKKKD